MNTGTKQIAPPAINQGFGLEEGLSLELPLQVIGVMLRLSPSDHTETSSTPQASQPGMPMDALALCPRACLMDHQQRVTNSSCKLQSNPLITLGKSQLEKRHAQFTSVRVALV